jgi:hypothetical protein
LNVNDKYKIESDELNVTLYEKYISEKGKNKGKELWKPVSYHGNVEMALKSLVDKEINGTGLKDIQAVVTKVQELKKLISEVI